MDCGCDSAECSCPDHDEEAINFAFYWGPADKVQSGIDGDTKSSFPTSITCMLGWTAAHRATKSLSVQEN